MEEPSRTEKNFGMNLINEGPSRFLKDFSIVRDWYRMSNTRKCY
jgi:hypothetical protein